MENHSSLQLPDLLSDELTRGEALSRLIELRDIEIAEILEELETQGSEPASMSAGPAQAVQLTLFGGLSPVEETLKKLDINALSPLEALNKLYELQQMARGKS